MKTIKIILALCLLPFFGFAQDTIVLKDGHNIIAKVNEVGIRDITYTSLDSTGEENWIIPSSKVDEIRFKNGSSEIIQPVKKDYFLMGSQDAYKYYTGNSAFIGGYVCGLTLIVGFLPASIMAAISPNQLDNSNNPRNKLLDSDPKYRDGFKRTAHLRKAGKALGGFLLGCATTIAVIVVLSF